VDNRRRRLVAEINYEDKDMLEGIWVRCALLGGAVWLLMGARDVLAYSGSPTTQVDLLGFTVVGLVVIVFAGLGLQWVTDYVVDRRAMAKN
jgi:hypothetical protein